MGRWNGRNLRNFMAIFRIKPPEMAELMDIDRSCISRLMNDKMPFNNYHDLLDKIMEAKKAGKQKEHEMMINFYNNFQLK